jgi:hypothetical protein
MFCDHDRGTREEVTDARGIFVTFVCAKCRVEKLKGFRADIFTDAGYWTDEPVEGDD